MEALGHHHLLTESLQTSMAVSKTLGQFPVLSTSNCSGLCDLWCEENVGMAVWTNKEIFTAPEWVVQGEVRWLPCLSVCLLPSSSGPCPPEVPCSPDVSQLSICSISIGEQLSSACEGWMFDPGPKSKSLVTSLDNEIYHQWKDKSIYWTFNLYFSGSCTMS